MKAERGNGKNFLYARGLARRSRDWGILFPHSLYASVGAGFYPARGRGRAPPLRTTRYAFVGADAYIGPTRIFPALTAGHTGPALQGVALSGPGGQGRPPLRRGQEVRGRRDDVGIGPYGGVTMGVVQGRAAG